MDKNSVTEKIRANIVREYMIKMEPMVDLSNELMSSITDKMFNVKLSMSILRGGIIDYQNGRVGSDLYEELNNIKKNLAESLSHYRALQRKLDKLKEIDNKSILRTEISKKHITKILTFHKIIDDFIKKNKAETIDKLYDLLDKILRDEDMKTISRENTEVWFSNCESIVNKSLQGVKSLRLPTKAIVEENKKYKDYLDQMGYDVPEPEVEPEPPKIREKSKWVSSGSGGKQVFVKKDDQ